MVIAYFLVGLPKCSIVAGPSILFYYVTAAPDYSCVSHLPPSVSENLTTNV